jgi:hypothetical protein
MAILELRAARGWSRQQTADVFLVTAATIASWIKRLDEEGPDALVQLREPVNRFPEFVRYAVRLLKTLCPTMGRAKIAQMLCRAGLHLGTTTVGRMLKENPEPASSQSEDAKSDGRVVTAKRPDHVWHVDLTAVAVGGGFWCSWLPFALPQCWPFCWWVAAVVDHYSRRVMGITVFKTEPSAVAIRAFLGRTIAARGAKPTAHVNEMDRQQVPSDNGTGVTPEVHGVFWGDGVRQGSAVKVEDKEREYEAFHGRCSTNLV